MNPTSLLTGLGAAITAEPTLGGAGTGGREAAPGTGDLFLALVAGLLSGDATKTAAPESAPGSAAAPGAPAPTDGPAAPTGSVVATTTPTTTTTTTPTEAPVALPADPALTRPASVQGLPIVPAPGPAPLPGTDDAQDPAEDQDVDDPSTGVPDPGTVAVEAALVPAIVVAPLPAAQQATPAVDSPAVDSPAGASVGATSPSTAVPARPVIGHDPSHAQHDTQHGAQDGAQDGAPHDAPGDSGPAPARSTATPVTDPPSSAHGVPRDLRDLRPEAATPTPTASSPAPVAAAAPTAPVAPATPTTSADPQRVTSQVFPEVVRVASSTVDGGPQRVTVKLNPEALGEVRVVLTHHKGELQVSLAGGEAARRALTEGAPELRRLLEAVGRTESRIVIRDLPGTSSPTSAPPVVQDGSTLRTDVSTDLGGNAWSGAGRPGGEPAAERDTTPYRTSGSTTATEGTPGATTLSRPRTTDTSSRSGGLDVSI